MVKQPKTTYWDPPWLQKSVLLAFTGFFLFLSAGLIVMWYLVNRYDGIPLTLTTNHYAWTYGPTVVLTVPLQVTSFLSALKNKHFAVAASIMIFTLLKVIMVISTTLFVLGNTSLTQDIPLQSSKFSDVRSEESLKENGQYSSRHLWDYVALQEQYRDAAVPLELSTAFTNYSIITKIPDEAAEVSVPVTAVKMNVTCEAATVGWSQDRPGESFNLTLNSSTCGLARFLVPACENSVDACTPTLQYFLDDYIQCNEENATIIDLDKPRNFTTTKESRHVIIAIESEVLLVGGEQDYSGNNTFSVTVHRASAITCGLEYSLNTGNAHGPAVETSKIDSLQITKNDLGQIGNLTNNGLQVLVYQVLGVRDSILIGDYYVSTTTHYGQNLLGLLADSRNVSKHAFDPLLNTSQLRDRTEQTLASFSH
ncbi:hypothetical protein F4678DRAFT_486126 [Xylaria arbuscula]|nr:hypothetical protein F4678DRAFT_486126 [Xylaria arbuscula]